MFDDYRFDLAISIMEKNNVQDCDDDNTNLYYIPTNDKVRSRVIRDWHNQFKSFLTFKDRADIYNRECCKYEIGDTLEKHQIFTINKFKIPSYIHEVLQEDFSPDRSIRQMHLEIGSQSKKRKIRSIISLTQESNISYILFQEYKASYQLTGGRLTMVRHPNEIEFKTVFEKGLTLNSSLAAVINISKRQLLFRNFRTAKRVLSLDKYFKIPSEKQIRKFITKDLFQPEDIDEIAVNPSFDIAEKIAIIMKQNKLDGVTAEQILKVAQSFEKVPNPILTEDGKKVIFPGKRREAYTFLKFLDEDFSKGYFTNQEYNITGKKLAS